MKGRPSESDEWDPIQIDPSLQSFVRTSVPEILTHGARLDHESCAEVVRAARALLVNAARDMADDDSLPYLAHALLASGRVSPVLRNELLLRVADFVQDLGAGPGILQHHPEGDFHPWQTFAYLTLVDPSAGSWHLRGGPDVETIARGSTDLGVHRAEELGHCLLASASLFPPDDEPVFQFAGRAADLEALVRKAIRAHWLGDFEVCRKFHLTAGVAAIVSSRRSLWRYRGLAGSVLAGQWRVLEAVAVLSRLLATEPDDDEVARLRAVTGLSGLFEDHLFYAGHLLELYNIADAWGFPVPEKQWLHSLLNDVNSWLLPRLRTAQSPSAYRVQLSHYLNGLVWHVGLGGVPVRSSPQRAIMDSGPSGGGQPFEMTPAEVGSRPRPHFAESVAALRRHVPALRFRGSFPHFRRARPHGWPRTLHYELLDYGDWLGAEVHIEGGDATWARPVLRSLAGVTPLPPGATQIEFDPDWWRGGGRLRLLFPPSAAAEQVASGMGVLVTATEDALTSALHEAMAGGRQAMSLHDSDDPT